MFAPPFTIEQFLAVFAAYNAAIWPAEVAAYLLGVLAVAALWLDGWLGTRLILSALSVMWAMNGIGYHYLFFAQINPAAKGFAALFVLQAVLLAASAAMAGGIRFRARLNLRSAFGLSLVVYAMLIYEVLGYWAGHGLMGGPLFGVAPCPTTIFTIGMLLLARGKAVVWLAFIPIVWSLIGLAAALQLGVPEDFGLAVAGIVLVIGLASEWSRQRHA
ncbi:MAG: DUF6064 family protein [Pseudorhodoplanes sp.]|nr:DUF6064 family protein [Pseudorhodoplanes sp.]